MVVGPLSEATRTLVDELFAAEPAVDPAEPAAVPVAPQPLSAMLIMPSPAADKKLRLLIIMLLSKVPVFIEGPFQDSMLSGQFLLAALQIQSAILQ